MKKYLVCVLIVQLFISCQHDSKKHNDRSIAVSDFRGKQILLQKSPQRVVCLIESALSGIYMLQVQDRVVGISTNVYTTDVFRYYSQLDERIEKKELPAPGNWDFINLESIVALKPELVIIWASQKESIENIESYSIPVYAVMLHSVKDVYKEIHDFGILFDNQERADSLIRFVQNEAALMTPVDKQKPSVYFMWSQGITETSGINSTVNDVIELAGCRNACQLDEEHVSVNIETLIHWNPDIIVMWYNEVFDPRDILNHPQLRTLKAIQQKNVFELPSIFESDLWTLKFINTVRFIHSHATASYDSLSYYSSQKRIFTILYGKQLSNKE